MADTDLVACLYPFEDNWNHAKEVIEKLNESRCVPGRLSLPEVQYGRHDREPTEEPGNSEASPLDYLPRIELRFSHGPRTSNGFVFGWDENSDIVLPWARGISFHHFAVTFDGRNYPVVKDLGSFSGIEVTYDRKGQGKRRDFVWIVGGYPIPEQTSIIINVNEQLKFQIVVPYHDISSQLYVDNVNKFRQGTTGVDNLVGQLDLRSRPPTERTSGTHTPGTGPIVLKKALGEGGFGVVSYMWDVSTGAEHALKEPSSKAIRANIVDIDAWMKEARIMGQISHVSYTSIALKLHSDVASRKILWPSTGARSRHGPNCALSICLAGLSSTTPIHQRPKAYRSSASVYQHLHTFTGWSPPSYIEISSRRTY